MNVSAADGRRLKVRRRILPWRRRLRVPDGLDTPLDLLSGVDDLIGGIVAAIALIVLLPLLVVLLVVMSELLVLLLLLPIVLLLRIAFRRPWIVDVTQGGEVVHAERVVGWHAAGVRVRRIAAELEKGSYAPVRGPVT